MANAQATEVVPPVAAAKVPLGSLLIVSVVAVVMAVGGCAGVLMYMAKSGRLGSASASAAQATVKPVPSEAPTKNVILEPMLVNLADEDGHSYLRVGVVLAEEVDPAKATKEEKPVPGANAQLRDAVLMVLGKKHAAELLATDGKEHLKDALKSAINQEVPDAKVHAVYFTEFLVQR